MLSSSTIRLISAICSAGKVSGSRASILLRTKHVGLLLNSGLIDLYSAICCGTVYPHCSLQSIKYRMQARRCAKAVMLCISIVLRSSSG